MGRAKVGATVGAGRRRVATLLVPFVTSVLTVWRRQCPASGHTYATSAAAVTSSAAMPVAGAGTGEMVELVLGPTVSVGTGMPVGSAVVPAGKVVMRQVSYGGACAVGVAGGVTSGGIFVAS